MHISIFQYLLSIGHTYGVPFKVNLPVQTIAFWSHYVSSGIYKNVGSGNGLPLREGDTCISLSGRHFDCGLLSAPISYKYRLCLTGADRCGLHDKCYKVSHGICIVLDIFGARFQTDLT